MSTITIKQSDFGSTKNGEKIKKYILSTGDGFEVSLIEFGATIQSIRQPDRNNEIREVTLGYDDLLGYENDQCSFGCTVGRVANRIKNGRFELNGVVYELSKNDGTKKHHLHGVFNKRAWSSSTENDDTVIFKYRSPDGEDGFPGVVDATMKYTLTKDHRLILNFYATSSKATPINLTNHAYFNLTGDPEKTVLDHKFSVNSDFYLPLDSELIPTGEILSVEKTPFDFRNSQTVGSRLNDSFDGYDMMFIIKGNGLRFFSKLSEETTGRSITVESTENGLQFYTGNFLHQVQGRGSTKYEKHTGLCLETQNFSDSLSNQPHFPSIIVKPGDQYHQQTIFHFQWD